MEPTPLSADAIFAIANPVALVGWLALLASPRWPRLADRLAVVVAALLAIVYSALVLSHWAGAPGGFATLDAVSELFGTRELLLAGWLHYLAFDLLIGAAIVRAGRAARLPFAVVLPCLPLTFLFGPAGYLLFIAIRAGLRPGLAVQAVEGGA